MGELGSQGRGLIAGRSAVAFDEGFSVFADGLAAVRAAEIVRIGNAIDPDDLQERETFEKLDVALIGADDAAKRCITP